MPLISNLRRAMRRAYHRTVDLSHPARSPLGSAVVNCVVYQDGERQPGDCPAGEAIRRVRKAGQGFVWIGLHEPDEAELTELAGLFGLHPSPSRTRCARTPGPRSRRTTGRCSPSSRPSATWSTRS